MLHRTKVEWPCLSCDWLVRERSLNNPKTWFPNQINGALEPSQTVVDRLGRQRHKQDKFPMTAYMVAGSQAEKKSDNKIYVMKWSEMYKTVNEDEENSDSEEEN